MTSVEAKQIEKKIALASFEAVWIIYPKRRGRKIGKAKAFAEFLLLCREDRSQLPEAVRNYASYCKSGPYPADMFRWIRNQTWREFLGSTDSHCPTRWKFRR